jgi:hypothetical protein
MLAIPIVLVRNERVAILKKVRGTLHGPRIKDRHIVLSSLGPIPWTTTFDPVGGVGAIKKWMIIHAPINTGRVRSIEFR